MLKHLQSRYIDQKIDFLKNSDILADIPAIQNDNIIVIDFAIESEIDKLFDLADNMWNIK